MRIKTVEKLFESVGSETQTQTVLTLGLDQITKFIYRLDGPLDEGNV